MKVSVAEKNDAFNWAISRKRFNSEVSRLGMYFMRALINPVFIKSADELSDTATQAILLAKDFAESTPRDSYDYADLEDLNEYASRHQLVSMSSSTASPSLARLVEIIYESEGYDLMDLSAVLSQIGEAVERLSKQHDAARGSLVEQAMAVRAWQHVTTVIHRFREEGIENPPMEMVLSMGISELEEKYAEDEDSEGDDEK